jgi:hypothetical protein
MPAGQRDTSFVVDWDADGSRSFFAEAVAVRAITLDDLAGRPHLAACGSEGARPPLSARRRDSTGP